MRHLEIMHWSETVHVADVTWTYCCPDTSHTTAESTGNGSPANNLRKHIRGVHIWWYTCVLTHLKTPFSVNPIPLLQKKTPSHIVVTVAVK